MTTGSRAVRIAKSSIRTWSPMLIELAPWMEQRSLIATSVPTAARPSWAIWSGESVPIPTPPSASQFNQGRAQLVVRHLGHPAMARQAHYVRVQRIGPRSGRHRPVVFVHDQRASRQTLESNRMGEEDRHQVRKRPFVPAVDEKRETERADDAGQAPELLQVGRADLLASLQPVEDEGGGHVGHLAVARPRAGVDSLVEP